MSEPTPDQIIKIKSFLDQGLSRPQLVDKLGISDKTLRRWLVDLELLEQSKFNGQQRCITSRKGMGIYFTDTETDLLNRARILED
jgi:hypothetical protein